MKFEMRFKQNQVEEKYGRETKEATGQNESRIKYLDISDILFPVRNFQ